MNWEIKLAPHGAAPHTTFMMMMMKKKMMTLSLMTMMPITSLRLARCSLVTRGEAARKETIGGTWPTIVRLVLHYYDVCKLERKIDYVIPKFRKNQGVMTTRWRKEGFSEARREVYWTGSNLDDDFTFWIF